jgi:opacity protein-like surface antigen
METGRLRGAGIGERRGMQPNRFHFSTTFLLLATACAVPSARDLPSIAPAASPTQRTSQDVAQQKEPAPRAYLRATGGLSLLPGTSLDSSDAGALQQADASFDPGFAYTFGGGYRVTDDWSVEAELGYRTNPIDRVRSTGQTLTEGDFASLGFFANGIYRVPMAGRLRPYVGLGIGLLEEIDIDLGSGTDVDYSDSALAAQAIVGVDYQLSSQWSLQLEGRYLQSFGQDLAAESGNGVTYDADYQPFSISLGLTWSF